jgi:hypothetical protein
MRLSGFLVGSFLVACFNPTYCYAQSGEEHQSGEPPEAYHKHNDTRHGHAHAYPDRGAIVRDLPRGTIGINYADVSYRYHDGIWLEPHGQAFRVVAPPIGIVVPALPTFSTILAQGGETYLYANDTYYRPRPDLGGYEVVNEPGGGSGSAATAPISAQPAAVPALAQTAAVPLPASAETTSSTAAAPAAVALPTGPPSASPSGPPSGLKVFLYPKNGQTPDQQARDREECYRYAVAQSGFDPTRSPGAASAAPSDGPQSDYKRAQNACLEALGYASR